MTLKDVLELDQYSPKDWGAEVGYDSWAKVEQTSQVFVHWGGPPVRDAAASGNVNSEKAQLRAYEDYHRNSKGWKGLAYDWAIGQSGTLYRIRGLGRSGATSGDVDGDGASNNLEGEGVLCLVGEGQEPSEDLLQTLVLFLTTMGYDEVYGHQEAKGTSTACPGPDLMDFVEGWRRGDYRSDSKQEPTQDKEPKGSTKPKDWTEQIVASLGTHRRGDRNHLVRRLQALLNITGQHSLKVDGIYGPQTERAVTEFQEHFRLTVDGVVGPQTWKTLLLSERF